MGRNATFTVDPYGCISDKDHLVLQVVIHTKILGKFKFWPDSGAGWSVPRDQDSYNMSFLGTKGQQPQNLVPIDPVYVEIFHLISENFDLLAAL